MHDGPKHGSGQRSNLYSRSRFTNWTRFDPYSSEVRGALHRSLAPELQVENAELPIFAIALHPGFLRPCNPAEVAQVLSVVPRSFLSGLQGVYLLGGTTKQARAARGSLFRFGYYTAGAIFLHAFPHDLMHFAIRRPLKPCVAEEYQRAGARIVKRQDCHYIAFDQGSLRRFYLYDVLLHEVGHHVDERVFSRPNRDAERYAKWFVEEQARRRREEGAA